MLYSQTLQVYARLGARRNLALHGEAASKAATAIDPDG